MSDRVIITGARSAVALDLARDFDCLGYEVHMADCSSAYISKWSKTPKCVHHYASPVNEPTRFTRDIQNIVKTIDPVMIVPTCEEVFHLSRLSLAEDFKQRLFSPSLSDLRVLHAKDSFIELCLDIGLNAPDTYTIKNKDDLQNYKDNSKEWVFKPCYSRFGAKTLITPNEHELATVTPDKDSPWIAQRYIKGQELSFYAVAHSGTLGTLAAYTSSWRLKGGASYVFEPVPEELLEEIRQLAEKIISKLSLTGQISCDLILDSRHKLWGIECNPRSTSGLHLLTGNGFLANAMINSEAKAMPSNKKSKYMLPMILTYGFTNALKNFGWKKWFDTLLNGQDVIGIKEDRFPVIGALIDTFLFMKYARKNKLSLTKATTVDIEWNGETLV